MLKSPLLGDDFEDFICYFDCSNSKKLPQKERINECKICRGLKNGFWPLSENISQAALPGIAVGIHKERKMFKEGLKWNTAS